MIAFLITFVTAIAISAVAAYFSIIGLAALFAASFIPVIIMGIALEGGKLVAVSWLHYNWDSQLISKLHKLYLTLAVIMLMAITALGIYGFLAKGHIEQQNPLQENNVKIETNVNKIERAKEKIERINNSIEQIKLDIANLNKEIDGIDAAISKLSSFWNSGKIKKLQADKAAVVKKVTAKEKELKKLAVDRDLTYEEIAQLADKNDERKVENLDVTVKLGPIKYVGELFGMTHPDAAVRIVIMMIMFVFDPLAIVLLLSSQISYRQWRGAKPQDEPTPATETVLQKEPVKKIKKAKEESVEEIGQEEKKKLKRSVHDWIRGSRPE